MSEWKTINFEGVDIGVQYDFEDRGHDPDEVEMDVYIQEMYIGEENVTKLLESRNKEIEQALNESLS